MNNNFTGFNPGEVRKQMTAIVDNYFEVARTFNGMSTEWQLGISELWYSPNAVEFDKVYVEKVYLINNQIVDCYCDIASSLKQTVDAWCDLNSIPRMEILSRIPDAGYPEKNDLICASQGPNGDVGMNTTIINNYMLPELSTWSTKLDEIISNIAPTISLWDIDGNQQHVYIKNIAKLKQIIFDAVEEITNSLHSYLSTEVRNTTLTSKVGMGVSDLD